MPGPQPRRDAVHRLQSTINRRAQVPSGAPGAYRVVRSSSPLEEVVTVLPPDVPMDIVAAYDLAPTVTGRDGVDDPAHFDAIDDWTGDPKLSAALRDSSGSGVHWTGSGQIWGPGTGYNTLSAAQKAYLDFDTAFSDLSTIGTLGTPATLFVSVSGISTDLSDITGSGGSFTCDVTITAGAQTFTIPSFTLVGNGTAGTYQYPLSSLSSGQKAALTTAWGAMDVTGTLRCTISGTDNLALPREMYASLWYGVPA